MKNRLITENALNCFTDCSGAAGQSSHGKYDVSCGFNIEFNGKIIESGESIILDTDSKYGERYAICMALDAALRLVKTSHESFRRVNIFSDSLGDVEIFKYMMKKYLVTPEREVQDAIKLDSLARAHKLGNLKLFDRIVRDYETINVTTPVRFYYVPAHVRYSFPWELGSMIKRFRYNNETRIDAQTARWICRNNQMIDYETSKTLRECMGTLFVRRNEFEGGAVSVERRNGIRVCVKAS